MSFVINPHRFGAGAVQYSEFYPVSSINTFATSFSMNFGDEHANRYLVASVCSSVTSGNGSITGVTIGGVAATELIRHGGTSNLVGSSLWIASVPTGTSGTVALTSTYNGFIVQLYRAVNLATSTPHGTDTASPISLTVPALGVALTVATTVDNGEVHTYATFSDSMLTSYSSGRNTFSSLATRGVHAWKVSPAGDSLSSAITLGGTNVEAGCSLRFAYSFAPPVAFESSHWSVADAATDGEVLVTITAIKNTGVTELEYQLDGGSWVSVGHIPLGPSGVTFAISGLTNAQEYDIAIRSVTVSGTGATSDVKQATPTDGGVTVTYINSVVGSSNVSAGTVSCVIGNGGHANAERMIVVGLLCADDLGGASNDPSAVTINGVSATKQVSSGSAGSRISQLWSAIVPTNTDFNDFLYITFTTTAFTTSQALLVYKAYGLASATAHDTFSSTASPTATGTIDCPAGGFIIGAFRGHNSNAVTWTGLTIEDTDVAWDTNRRLSGAHDDFASTQTGLTVSANQTSGTANRLAVASWG